MIYALATVALVLTSWGLYTVLERRTRNASWLVTTLVMGVVAMPVSATTAPSGLWAFLQIAAALCPPTVGVLAAAMRGQGGG